jgi:hypothetical protein
MHGLPGVEDAFSHVCLLLSVGLFLPFLECILLYCHFLFYHSVPLICSGTSVHSDILEIPCSTCLLQ